MIIKEIKNFTHGIIDALEPQSLPPGSMASALNFLTKGDKMELRRGFRVLGTSNAGTGQITGLHIGAKIDGTEIPFRTRDRKVEYYDSTTEDWIEIGTNTLPADANNEDVAFDSYNSQAGAQVYLSSPNSSIYKIMTANPGSITDLSSTTYRGKIKIKQSRMFLWDRKDANGRRDEANPYMSYIDNRQYTTVNAESLGTGDDSTKTFAITLAFKAAGAKRTCFGIVIKQAGSAVAYDDRNGAISGTNITGTINYTSGALSVTWTTAPTAGQALTVDYQWEDVTNQGLGDFTFSTPRTAGQGNIFVQGDGGKLQNIETLRDAEYCLHEQSSFELTLTKDDTGATNLLFRRKVGLPNWRASVATGDGIYYINDTDKNEPRFEIIEVAEQSTEVEPRPISRNINLVDYRFDKAWAIEWGDYILFGCRHKDSANNNRAFLYHKIWKSIDAVDYYAAVAAIYNGALLIGESISDDVIEAFSGTDDNEADIIGHAELNLWDLEYPGFLKKVKKIQIEGDIGTDQIIDVYASVDRSAWVKIGEIKGNGAYVDMGQSVNVGSITLGRSEIAGGSDGIIAYHYFKEIDLGANLSFGAVDKFEYIKLKFEVQSGGIGYFSFSTIRFYDIRLKSTKLPRKYRS